MSAPVYQESQMKVLAFPIDEKVALEDERLINSDEQCESGKGRCCRRTRGAKRNALVKAGMVAMMCLLVTVLSIAMMAFFCPEMGGLVKRQSSGSNSGNSGSAFTQQKLWIIIVVVVGMFTIMCECL